MQSYYGHIVSLQRSSAGYLMRFDPALFLSGVTANAAAAADLHVACAPEKCEAVPNDNYVVDESNRSYVFRVPESVRGTVLTSGSNLNGTSILVAQLAQIVAGKGMRLFEPLESGVWDAIPDEGGRALEPVLVDCSDLEPPGDVDYSS